MNGNVQKKALSEKLLTNLTLERLLEIILLILSGSIAIVLHARLRTPINVPGHHGIEFMTILIATRLSSKLKYASSISAIGVGIFMLFPVLGFKDPFAWFNYMLPFLMLDVFYNNTKSLKFSKLLLILGAGVAYMMVPLSRLLISLVSGYTYPVFLKHGMISPVFTFFIFGLAGGILGSGLYVFVKKIIRKL
jgi:hypothetical protein